MSCLMPLGRGEVVLVRGRERALGLKAPLAAEVVVDQADLVEVHHYDVAAGQDVVRADVDGKRGLVGLGVGVDDDDLGLVEVRGVVDDLRLLDAFVVLLDGVAAVGVDDLAAGVEQRVHLEIKAGQHGGFLLVLAHALVLQVAVALIEGPVAVEHHAAELHFVVGDIGVEAGDAGQDDLAAAAEAVEGVRRDGAEANLDVGGHELVVYHDLDAVRGGADVGQVEEAVVVVYRVLAADVRAQLFDEVVQLAGAVAAEGADKDYPVLRHAGL